MGRARTRRPEGVASLIALSDDLMEMQKGVVACGSARRIEEIAPRLIPREAEALLRGGRGVAALELVADLALFTAPPGRSTAVQRYAKQTHPPAGSDQARLLAALLDHRFTLFESVTTQDARWHTARDLLTGETFDLVTPREAAIAEPGTRLAGRLIPLAEGRILVSAVALLDDDALETLRPWISRDGRSLANPARCAESVYRHAIAQGRVMTSSVPADEEDPEDDSEAFLRHAAAMTADSKTLSPEWQEALRQRTRLDDVLIALQYLRVRRTTRDKKEADAYERILSFQLETLHRRALIGHAPAAQVLASLDAEIERAIAAREIPPLYRTLYHEVNARARTAATGGAADDESASLDRLRARIQALRAKTVERGCTEQEALAAAAKVADLLDRHGLSLSELEMRQQACDGAAIETGRKRRAPIDKIVPVVASFCDCRAWGETGSQGDLRFIFFGLPADVVAARCLYELIAEAMTVETAAFKTGPLYAEHPSNQRASATRSFQVGMIQEIAGKLSDLKTLRTRSTLASSGRDLVPLKADIVEEELSRLGLRFTTKAAPSNNRVLIDAYHAGRAAGLAFDPEEKIEAETPRPRPAPAPRR